MKLNKEQKDLIINTALDKMLGVRLKDKHLDVYPRLESIAPGEKIISIYGSNGVGKTTLSKQFITDEVINEINLDNISSFITLNSDFKEGIHGYFNKESNNNKIISNDYSKRINKISENFYSNGISFDGSKLIINFTDYIDKYDNDQNNYLITPSLECFYLYYHPIYFINSGFMKEKHCYFFNPNFNSEVLSDYNFVFLVVFNNDKSSKNEFLDTIQANLQNIGLSLDNFLTFLEKGYDNDPYLFSFLDKTQEGIYIDNHFYEGQLRFSYIVSFFDYIKSHPHILDSLISINKIKDNERKVILSKIILNNENVLSNFLILKPILKRHFSHIFDEINIYPIFCPFYNTFLLNIHIIKDGISYPFVKFLKILNSANRKIMLLIKMFLITPKHSSCLIVFDDFFSSLDNQNIYNISSFLLDVLKSCIINENYRFVNLTHDITVFKKINQIFSLPYKNKNTPCVMYSLHSIKNEEVISLNLSDFQIKKNFYIDYVKKQKFDKIYLLKNVILILISLPYFRGIIEDTYEENNDYYRYTTNYLHYKEINLASLKTILNSDYFNNMNCFFNNKEDVFSIIDSYSNYWEMLEACYIYISSKEIINIEDSLFLSLYSRIYIEREILLILTDSEELDLEYMNHKYPYNQTAMLIDEYKKKYPLQTNIIYEIECIKKIFSNFMHINSTEYQYIVNISHVYILNTIESLKKLFIEAKK